MFLSVTPTGVIVSLGALASVCGDARLQRTLYLAHIYRAVHPCVHLLLGAKGLVPSCINKDSGAFIDPKPAPVAACVIDSG